MDNHKLACLMVLVVGNMIFFEKSAISQTYKHLNCQVKISERSVNLKTKKAGDARDRSEVVDITITQNQALVSRRITNLWVNSEKKPPNSSLDYYYRAIIETDKHVYITEKNDVEITIDRNTGEYTSERVMEKDGWRVAILERGNCRLY